MKDSRLKSLNLLTRIGACTPAAIFPYAESRCLSLEPLHGEHGQVCSALRARRSAWLPSPHPKKKKKRKSKSSAAAHDKWSRAPRVRTMQRENETRVSARSEFSLWNSTTKKPKINHCNKHVGKYQKDHATLHRQMALN